MKLATCDVGMDSRNARSAQVQRLGASWVRFGDRLLLVASNAQWGSVATQAVRGGLRLEEYPSDVNAADLYLVVQKGRLFQQQYPDVPVLLDKGRYLAVKLSPEERAKVDTKEAAALGSARFQRIPWSSMCVRGPPRGKPLWIGFKTWWTRSHARPWKLR